MEKLKNFIGQNRIILGKDGVYRWIYEFNLLKNPIILFVIWKILILSFGGVWVFVTLLSIGDRDFEWERFWNGTKVFALIIVVMLILGLIAYLVYAAIIGGKYCVLFEMDENGIKHTQLPGQFKKVQILSEMTVIFGMASGNIGTVGSGLLAVSRNFMSSEWGKVKSIAVYPNRNTIKVNETLNKNQVYALDRDFEFVKQYVLDHCPNAKVHLKK